jgi:GNAT superfamily N-acetyltransferase
MKIRPIEASDVTALIELRGRTRENAMSPARMREAGITPETVAEMLATSHRGWLCEVEGGAVAFSIGDGNTGELWVIAVLPEFEGKGVGSRLLESVETWLWSLGWKELWLWTSPDKQKRAFGFYQKRGWAAAEEKDGRLYMRKRQSKQQVGGGAQRNA